MVNLSLSDTTVKVYQTKKVGNHSPIAQRKNQTVCTDITCQKDRFIAGFHLFMGFVDIKKNRISPAFSFKSGYRHVIKQKKQKRIVMGRYMDTKTKRKRDRTDLCEKSVRDREVEKADSDRCRLRQ